MLERRVAPLARKFQTLKKTLVDFSLADKIWLLDLARSNPRTSAVDLGTVLADHLYAQRSSDQVRISAPGRATVNDWKRNEQSLRQKFESRGPVRKGARAAQHPQLEEALKLWFAQQVQRDLTITDEMLRTKAKAFAHALNVPQSFAFSAGWLDNF
jgi:hypothetical protein